MDNNIEKLRLHFFYCAVILVLVIIAIATDRWTLQPKFTEFLSNAATMTSLVLGLVAIFYSFIANDGLSKSLGSIGTVSDEVKSTREQIVKQVTLGVQTTQAAERSAALIESASSAIGANLSSLSATLAEIQTHTEFLHGSLGDLPSRLNQLETKVIDATKSLGAKPDQAMASVVNKNVDSAIAQSFLATSSLAANALTYACVLAQKTGKKLVLSEFCTAIDSKLENYLSGFLACMKAVNLVDITEDESARRTYKVDRVHPSLSQTTRDYVIGFIDRHYKSANPPVYERWKTAMDNVDKLFVEGQPGGVQ
jgi:hypothetical protein